MVRSTGAVLVFLGYLGIQGVVEASRRTPKAIPGHRSPAITNRQTNRDRITRRLKYIAENPGLRKRDTSAISYLDCNGYAGGMRTAHFLDVNFTPQGAVLSDAGEEATPEGCMYDIADDVSEDATVAYWRDPTCKVYQGFVSGSIVTSAGDSMIFKSGDCATNIQTYGLPPASGGTTPSCCNLDQHSH